MDLEQEILMLKEKVQKLEVDSRVCNAEMQKDIQQIKEGNKEIKDSIKELKDQLKTQIDKANEVPRKRWDIIVGAVVSVLGVVSATAIIYFLGFKK